MQMACWCKSGTDDSFGLVRVCSVCKNRPQGESERAILGSIMFTHLHFEERIWRQYLIAVFVTGVYQSCFEAWIVFHLSCIGPCSFTTAEKYISPMLLHLPVIWIFRSQWEYFSRLFHVMIAAKSFGSAVICILIDISFPWKPFLPCVGHLHWLMTPCGWINNHNPKAY